MVQAYLPLGIAPPVAESEFDPDSWCTPKWFVDYLPVFDLDPCSNERSHIVAKQSLTIADNGLSQPWVDVSKRKHPLVWCNPPYSDVMPWAKMAVECAREGGTVVMLVKLDPSTKWWAELMPHANWYAFRKRMQFEGGDGVSNNFCSALIVLGMQDKWHRHPAVNDLIITLKQREVIW